MFFQNTQILYECIVNIYCSNVSNKVILGLFILGSELRRPNYIKYYSATRIISFRVFYCWFIGISCSEHISFNARLLTEHKVVGSGLEMEKHNVHNEIGNTLEAHKRKSNCKKCLVPPKKCTFFQVLSPLFQMSRYYNYFK